MSFINRNKETQRLRVGNFACDKLPPKQKQRLALMVQEIEDNLDEIMEEKKAYFGLASEVQSKVSKLSLQSNAYSLVPYE